MTCTVGYFFVNNEKKCSYCALATYELFVRVYLRSSLKIVKQGFNTHWNKLSVAFLCSFNIQGTKDVSRTADFKRPGTIDTLVSSFHLGVHRGITDDVATWVSYGTSLIVLVCSWLSHDVAIWVHLSFHLRPLPYQTNLMINLAKMRTISKPMIQKKSPPAAKTTLVSVVGCGLWLRHSLDFSINFFYSLS